jgi:transcription initiation factor TFIIH subunit 3
VIIETHPEAWATIKDQITFKQAIQALLVFINGHIALNNSNKVCVIASHDNGGTFLYPRRDHHTTTTAGRRKSLVTVPDPSNSNGNGHDAVQREAEISAKYGIAHAQSMYRQFRDVDESVYRAIGELMEKTPEENDTMGGDKLKKKRNASLSGALSLALAYINKVSMVSDEIRLKSRVLIISVMDDMSSQYIPTMNCIFAAQKQVSFYFFFHYFFQVHY